MEPRGSNRSFFFCFDPRIEEEKEEEEEKFRRRSKGLIRFSPNSQTVVDKGGGGDSPCSVASWKVDWSLLVSSLMTNSNIPLLAPLLQMARHWHQTIYQLSSSYYQWYPHRQKMACWCWHWNVVDQS